MRPTSTARQWGPSGFTLRCSLVGHTDDIQHIAWTPDSRIVATASADKTIRIWDAVSGEVLRNLEGHSGGVCALAVFPNGKWIVSASDDASLIIWDVELGRAVRTLSGHGGPVRAVVVTRCGTTIVSASEDSSIKIWDASTGRVVHTLVGHSQQITALALAPDGKTVVSASHDDTLKLWDIDEGTQLLEFAGHQNDVNGVIALSDGRTIASTSYDRTLRFWDMKTGELKHTQEFFEDSLLSLSVSPSERIFALKSLYGRVIFFDYVNLQPLTTLRDGGHNSAWHRGLAFAPSGAGMATTGWDVDTVAIWDIDATALPRDFAPQKYYTCAKVVLVGESGVGKTALANRIAFNRFVPTESTHGMQLFRINVPLGDAPGLECEVLLWDLAGQPDFQLVNKLFLDETSVALILFDSQKDDPFSDILFWINSLKQVTKRNPQLILVSSQVDLGTPRIGDDAIRAFWTDYGSMFIRTSAKTGLNCSDDTGISVKSCIGISISVQFGTLPTVATPQVVVDVKNAILEIVATEHVNLLRLPELARYIISRSPGSDIGDVEVQNALRLLANQGIVTLFTFGSLVLLRPEQLNIYANALIRAARAHEEGLGVVSEQAFCDFAFDWQNMTRIPRVEEELLVRAVVQTLLEKSLCIAEETPAGRQLVFPAMYSRERNLECHPDVVVTYDFTGDHPRVYSTLVVRLWYSNVFRKRELWRNGAEFTTSKNQVIGLVLSSLGPTRCALDVFSEHEIPDELQAVFLEYVHLHLQRYASNILRVRHYKCPRKGCRKLVRDEAAVLSRLSDGKGFIYCSYCDCRIPLIDHIEEACRSTDIAVRAHRMDEGAATNLDNQAREQVLIGEVLAVCGEANQIFRPTTLFDYGIDGEIEFKDARGVASGQRIYVQLKNGESYLRESRRGNCCYFYIKNARHVEYWLRQTADVYLIVRRGNGETQWMNVSAYLRGRKTRQVVFDGVKFDVASVLDLRRLFVDAKRE